MDVPILNGKGRLTQTPSKIGRLQWLGFPIFVIVSLIIVFLLNQQDPKAQMDETCHIPQAVLFCDGIYDQVLILKCLIGICISTVSCNIFVISGVRK